jgi:hypothetical protein
MVVFRGLFGKGIEISRTVFYHFALLRSQALASAEYGLTGCCT